MIDYIWANESCYNAEVRKTEFQVTLREGKPEVRKTDFQVTLREGKPEVHKTEFQVTLREGTDQENSIA